MHWAVISPHICVHAYGFGVISVSQVMAEYKTEILSFELNS